jgi:hypothetical protein
MVLLYFKRRKRPEVFHSLVDAASFLEQVTISPEFSRYGPLASAFYKEVEVDMDEFLSRFYPGEFLERISQQVNRGDRHEFYMVQRGALLYLKDFYRWEAVRAKILEWSLEEGEFLKDEIGRVVRPDGTPAATALYFGYTPIYVIADKLSEKLDTFLHEEVLLKVAEVGNKRTFRGYTRWVPRSVPPKVADGEIEDESKGDFLRLEEEYLPGRLVGF